MKEAIVLQSIPECFEDVDRPGLSVELAYCCIKPYEARGQTLNYARSANGVGGGASTFRPCFSPTSRREALGKVGAQRCVLLLTTTRAICVAGLQQVDAGCLCLLPCRSLAWQTCKPFVVRAPLLPRCDTFRAYRSFLVIQRAVAFTARLQ